MKENDAIFWLRMKAGAKAEQFKVLKYFVHPGYYDTKDFTKGEDIALACIEKVSSI